MVNVKVYNDDSKDATSDLNRVLIWKSSSGIFCTIIFNDDDGPDEVNLEKKRNEGGKKRREGE